MYMYYSYESLLFEDINQNDIIFIGDERMIIINGKNFDNALKKSIIW